MDYSADSLSPLQRSLLSGLAGHGSFFVTGGAALGAFFLHHRLSRDIDLFVTDEDELDQLDRRVRALCADRGWVAEEIRRTPHFRRYLVRDGPDETLVDLVYEPVAQIVALADKPTWSGIRVDSLDDLVANKLCALLGRGDTKDLVDAYYLSEAGIDVLAYLDASKRKDGGMEAATLARVLTGMPIDPVGLLLFEPLAAATLAAFRDQLVDRLLRTSWPRGHP